MAEHSLSAKRIGPRPEAVGNKTTAKASGIDSSNVDGDALLLAAIYNQEPCADWFKHPEFQPPKTNWINQATGRPLNAVLLHN